MDPREAEFRQAVIDEEHLKLLPVFYWTLGGVSALVALYGFVYIGMGAIFATVPMDSTMQEGAPPAFIGWFFIAMGVGFLAAFGLVAALQILTGFSLRARRRRTLCLVTAGISCLFVPFGTVLGVFTFIALLRPSVAALFAPPADEGATPIAGS